MYVDLREVVDACSVSVTATFNKVNNVIVYI